MSRIAACGSTHLKVVAIPIRMSAAISFVKYCGDHRDPFGYVVLRSGTEICISIGQQRLIERVTDWANDELYYKGEPLPIILNLYDCDNPVVINIVAVLDGCIRDAQGSIIATVAVRRAGDWSCTRDRNQSREQILSWVVSSIKEQMLCIKAPGLIAVPDLTKPDELERLLRNIGGKSACLAPLPVTKYLPRPTHGALRYQYLYALAEEDLARAEERLSGMGYSPPEWRTRGPNGGAVSITLHSFIRHPFADIMLGGLGWGGEDALADVDTDVDTDVEDGHTDIDTDVEDECSDGFFSQLSAELSKYLGLVLAVVAELRVRPAISGAASD